MPSTSNTVADRKVASPPDGPRSKIWPHLRALFVVLHVTAISLDASPTPGAGMSRSAWKDPTVQSEFARWAGILGVDKVEFENRLWDFAVEFVGVRRTVMAPISPYLQWTGTEQSWQMFVAPHRYPTKMEIRVRKGEEYTTVFEERSPTATWNAEIFGTERLRASIFRWGWSNYQEAWKKACWQIAGRLLEEYPEADAAQCRMHKRESPSPEDLKNHTVDPGKYVYAIEYTRERRAGEFKASPPPKAP